MDFEKVKVKIGEQIVEENLQESIRFSVDDEEVLEKMSKAASRYAYWSTIAVVQKKRLNEIEDEFEHWKAVQRGALRADAGKTTEKALDEQLIVNPEYQKRQKAVRDNDSKLEIIKTAIRAYEKQMQMLQSVGATRRVELQRLSNVATGSFDLDDE